MIDSPFAAKDAVRAFRRLAKAKSPGPDKLPAEFYQDFEYMLIDPFMEMINQTQKQGYFEPGVRSGEIALHTTNEQGLLQAL
jgi:hypothetical protein